jgi:hypothetical protein
MSEYKSFKEQLPNDNDLVKLEGFDELYRFRYASNGFDYYAWEPGSWFTKNNLDEMRWK